MVHKLSSGEKISAELRFEPGAAGRETKMLPLCYTDPPEPQRIFHSKGPLT